MATLEQLKEELAKRDFTVFLDYVYILGVAGSSEGGAIKFVKWPHLLEVAVLLCSNDHEDRRLAWLKARQIGCTWLIAAWTLWSAMYHEGTVVVEFAEKEDKAKEIIRKQKFIYNHLPEGLQEPPKSLDNQLTIVWENKSSSITAYPATADAAIGLTTSIVWFDEFDFHEYGAEALEATAPLVNDTGGKILLTSTSNPDTAIEGSPFKTIFANALSMNWQPIFYGWDCRPDRDLQWYEDNYKAAVDKFAFVKHYPRTAEEALAPPANRVAFDHFVLDSMKADVRLPVEVIQNVINIYQKPVKNKKYVAATDTSHGVGGDYAVTGVMDLATGYIVADILRNDLSPEDLADYSVTLLEYYNSPLWGIEDNDWGRSTIARAEELGYSNLFYQAEDKPGWHTSAQNRFPIWSEFIEAIHQRLVTIPNEDGLKQFYTVIRNPDKQGRIEALTGQNDDYPMMGAILWQLRKEQSAYGIQSSKPITIKRWR